MVGTRTLIRYYGKRWGIETSFRDIKDMRFGMGLSARRVSSPQRRDRMLLLSALVGETQKAIPEAGRIEDVRVEQRREDGHGLLQAEVLIDGGQFIQRVPATRFRLAAVVKDVSGADTAMRAYLATGDSVLVEQLHQVRSRHL